MADASSSLPRWPSSTWTVRSGRNNHVPLRPDLLRRGLIRRSFLLPRPLSRAPASARPPRLRPVDRLRTGNISRIPVVELERIAYENFVEYVRPRLYDGVVDHFNGLRRRGTPIVLVSSSPGLVIEPLSIYLGCTATLTTPVVIERNRMIGMGTGPACYGDGKLYWAERWAEEHGLSMLEAVGYADNWSDRALLDASATQSWSTPKADCFVWCVPEDGT